MTFSQIIGGKGFALIPRQSGTGGPVSWADVSGKPAILTSFAGLSNSAGILKNDGAGALSWLETSTGGNNAADEGKLVVFGEDGRIRASDSIGIDMRGDGETGVIMSKRDISFYSDAFNFTRRVILEAPSNLGLTRTVTLPDDSGIVLLGITPNNGSSLTNLNASNLASGTVPTARLGTGTANSTTYLRGDNTWQTIASGDTPGGSGSELQYRAGASTLGAVTGSSVSGGALTLTAPLTVAGTTNAAQFVVKGHSTQTAALQEWQNSAATVVAKVDNAGTHYALASGAGYLIKRGDADTGMYSPDTASVGFVTNGTGVFYASSNYGAQLNASSGYFGFSTAPHVGSTADVRLYRDGAGILAQRNSTNAQTHRVYGTYMDASNYVRLAFNTTSTTLAIAAETAGTGADDIDITLTPAGTGRVKFGSHSAIGSETVTGYIEIKDSGGTTRKIAVLS